MSFGTLLVANRGEIAVRVIRTAQAMGLRVVAVYSDADREAAHVRLADEAIRIGPAPAAESYLSIPALLAAADESGADAIHPGYGFLSERADFARAVTDRGLVFVGPGADVIERMGRKDHAREVAVAAGVPVVPGFDLASAPAAEDYPLLVKAAAGGGGKGMHVVREPAELEAAVARAAREAGAAFGDDTLLVERYVERGRHVEVQVIGDRHGSVLHLFERDCSAQRRHQKVVEECPAPTISAALRDRLTRAAVDLAREAGYTNAGTVEFLVDEARADTAYFLEMNTRLQVEHPVTEAVTGLDLVELQLRVARGEELPIGQDDVRCDGHAIEARVYAEDAFGGFLPQAGTASYVRWSGRARTDVALRSGQVVTSDYDPMVGKVIVHAPDREAARRKLVSALDDTTILGLTTNLGFVRALLAGDAFRDAAVDTAWLDRHPDEVRPADGRLAPVFAVWAIADHEIDARPGHPFGTADGWRLGSGGAPATIGLEVAGEPTRWTVTWHRVSGPGIDVPVRLVERDERVLRLEIDGQIETAGVSVGHRHVEVMHRGTRFHFVRPDPFGPDGPALADGVVVSPMPGTVLSVSVVEGDLVEEGTVLGAIEAMKMEFTVRAPTAGRVTTVAVTTGQQVPQGAGMFEVTDE